MTYLSPTIQFLQGYIASLVNAGVTVPILTMGYNDNLTGDYIYLHVNIDDDSSKNTQQVNLDVYAEIISVDATSIMNNALIEEKVLSLIGQPDVAPMSDFRVNGSSLIRTTTQEALSENKRYFNNTIRMEFKLNKIDVI